MIETHKENLVQRAMYQRAIRELGNLDPTSTEDFNARYRPFARPANELITEDERNALRQTWAAPTNPRAVPDRG